jgi:hypothetical protein
MIVTETQTGQHFTAERVDLAFFRRYFGPARTIADAWPLFHDYADWPNSGYVTFPATGARVLAAQHELRADVGDWILTSEDTGERRVVPASAFDAAFTVLHL